MSGDQLNHHSSPAAEPGAWQFGNQGIQMADSLYPNIWNHPNTNKRKKNNQDIELDQVPQASQFPAEIPKVDTMDGSKQDYIHLRARRGQATNSHSLAERVRRERISERMKYLQELVPGCSEVTGKAVMLDEIINYVQSLQRQVEFLSMKLAAVNPSIDLNVEGLLSKDMSDPWEAELQNMGKMNYGANHPPSTQEFNGKPNNVFPS